MLKTLLEQSNNKTKEDEIQIPIYNPIADTIIVSYGIPILSFKKSRIIANEIKNDITTTILTGLSDIKVSKFTDGIKERACIKLTISAKFLAKDYFLGMLNNNYKQTKDFIVLILRHFGIDARSIRDDDLKCISVHLRNDYPTAAPEILLDKFSNITNYNSTAYAVDKYNRQSLVFKTKNSTRELRTQFTIYNKSLEFQKSRNKMLRGFFEDAKLELNTGVLRLEQKLNSIQMINYYLFGAKDKTCKTIHSVKEVLEPKRIINPVYREFKNIFPYLQSDSVYMQDTWLSIARSVGFSKFIKALGIGCFQIMNQDDRAKCESSSKQMFHRTTSIPKKKRLGLVESLPIIRPFSSSEYNKFTEDLIRRTCKYFNMSNERSDENALQSVERYLYENGNRVNDYLLCHDKTREVDV